MYFKVLYNPAIEVTGKKATKNDKVKQCYFMEN